MVFSLMKQDSNKGNILAKIILRDHICLICHAYIRKGEVDLRSVSVLKINECADRLSQDVQPEEASVKAL